METKEEKKIAFPLRLFLGEIIFFSLVLALGILAAQKLSLFLERREIVLQPISFFQFLILFFLATLFIFLLSKFISSKKRGPLFRILFVIISAWGGIIFLSLWIYDFSLILIAILIYLWFKKGNILIHDLLVIFGICGIAPVLGLKLEPKVVIFLLILFSIYDFIAVYKTKHMVKMAKALIEERAILGLIFPPKFSDFFASLKEVRPGGRFLVLGGGDLAFPLLFCSSLIPEGILISLVVGFFSLIGLSVSFLIFIFQKVRAPIPALPPIAFFSIVGYLLAKIL